MIASRFLIDTHLSKKPNAHMLLLLMCHRQSLRQRLLLHQFQSLLSPHLLFNLHNLLVLLLLSLKFLLPPNRTNGLLLKPKTNGKSAKTKSQSPKANLSPIRPSLLRVCCISHTINCKRLWLKLTKSEVACSNLLVFSASLEWPVLATAVGANLVQ